MGFLNKKWYFKHGGIFNFFLVLSKQKFLNRFYVLGIAEIFKPFLVF